MSDCTGCRNTQALFMLTELLWDHKFLPDHRMSENSGVGLHRFHCIRTDYIAECIPTILVVNVKLGVHIMANPLFCLLLFNPFPPTNHMSVNSFENFHTHELLMSPFHWWHYKILMLLSIFIICSI